MSYLADITEVFHPKVYIAETLSKVHLFVGSNNATRGGLERNIEVLTHTVFERRYDGTRIAAVETIWSNLARIAETRLTDRLIDERKHELAILMPVRATNPHARVTGAVTIIASLDAPRTLSKIVNRETGAGGTQVQFPVQVVRDYFGNDGVTPTRLSIYEGGRRYSVQLTHHPNNTHRIVLPFLQGIPRPALVQLKRISDAAFSAKTYSSKAPEFARTRQLGTTVRRGANPFRIS
jgi:hypothetical protein